MNIIKFAIDMELDGQKFYSEQAEINNNNELHSVCLMIAEDERKHAEILTDQLNNTDFQLVDSKTLSKAKNIYAGRGDIKSENAEIASQLEFYRIAMEMEKKSIELYMDFSSKAVNAKEKELFDFLLMEENQHFQVLSEIVNLLQNSEEWVEFAEFGVRKEY